MNRIVADLLCRAGIAAAVMSAWACTSTSELERVQTQLAEIHFELLELRKQAPSKEEVEGLGSGLGREIESLAASQVEVERQLRALIERIGELESKLDDTTFRLTQLAQRIDATNQQLQEVRSATELARRTPAPPPVTPSTPTDPRALYDTAYNDYVRGSFDLAILAFRQYVESYPSTDLADNSVYWIGECYFSQGKFEKAIEQFDAVLKRFEGSDRIPSALLKKGFANLELGQRAAGVTQLQNVICNHGGTDEARLARQRLDSLGIDAECPGT